MIFNIELLITQFVQYLEARKISVREAERLIVVSNSTLAKAIENKSLSKNLLKKIQDAFPDFKIDESNKPQQIDKPQQKDSIMEQRMKKLEEEMSDLKSMLLELLMEKRQNGSGKSSSKAS